MKSFTLLSLLLILPGSSLAQAAHKTSCSVVSENSPAPNAAVELEWKGKIEEARAAYQSLLAARPGDPDLTEGFVRLAIGTGKDLPAAAAAAAASVAANPNHPAAVTAQGESLFRAGQIPEADKLFARATQLDPCYAPARLQIARVARATSMYASAVKAIQIAHALNQRDPDINFAWIHTLPRAERLAELKKLATRIPPDSEEATMLQRETASLEDAIANGTQHRCEIAAPAETAKIVMQPILWDATHIQTWGLDTEMNGQTARLVLDSGASGLVVGRSFATRAHLKMAESSQMGGFGDHGPQKSYIAYVDKLRIGSLEFHDCRVRVSDKRDVIGNSGLIGPDVFSDYLVSINYPDHVLTLGPLPPRADSQQNGPHTLDTNVDEPEGEQSEVPPETRAAAAAPHDRYVAPEMKGFTPAYRFGHWLLIPGMINEQATGLLALDTGDGVMSLSYEAAAKVTHAHLDSQTTLRGLSGKVERLSTGGDVRVTFGRVRTLVPDVFILDNSTWSNSFGTEVSGFVGYPALHRMVFQIDYRDGLVNFIYDVRKDPDYRAPGTECSYCDPAHRK